MIQFEKCRLADLATFAEYLGSFTAPFDSYLEKHILESEFFRIAIDGRDVGSYAVSNERLLTHFHIRQAARRHSRSCFSAILARTGLDSAYVVTSDEHFLSTLLDYELTVSNLGYTFQEGIPLDGAAQPEGEFTFRPARADDAEDIGAVSKDFFTHLDADAAAGRLHVCRHQTTLCCIGIIEPSLFWPNRASIGMFTNESWRRRGIGTRMILHLRKTCHERGLTPAAGCWYYNHPSKKTLEAAGMVTSTRLLSVQIGGPKLDKSPA